MLTIGITTLNAQAPPKPPSNANAGGLGPVGGDTGSGAPVGNGTFILLTLAVVYAGRKISGSQADKVKKLIQ